MPLLHRKAFIRQKPPVDLRPEEEVFLCKITHEIFRSYDEFFERTILCNSLVWSCALTGRAGLTYLEAAESERRARQSLQNFPLPLVAPLLHLAAQTRRLRLSELCEDVYTFVKDRFFLGETVDVGGRNGSRHVCEVLQVHCPHSSTKGTAAVNGTNKLSDGDTIVISDSDEDGDAFQSPTAQVNRNAPLCPSMFKYTVRMMKGHSEAFTVRANEISRRKGVLTRERLKLFFKQHCEPVNGSIVVKAATMEKYRLSEQTFSQFFPDNLPAIPFSLHTKGGVRGSPSQARSSLLKATEELKLIQQRQEMMASSKERARLKREKEEAQEARRREKEDREKLKEEQRRRFEVEKQRRKEEKERRKLEKEREREKLKEEKKKYAERLKLWNKPREDMECEDLKDLPSPAPVRTRLPAELFGEALMVLEFLRAFGDVFDLKDEFPDGVSLEVLEEALVGSDPEGPLCEMLFFFLSAIFQALDEEQEEVATRDPAEDLSEALDDDSDQTASALSAVASLAAAWPQIYQGCSLRKLDLDSCTLSEILRLHILASGADSNHGNDKFRHQKQSCFSLTDDPCVELRLTEPVLLKRLSYTSVYDLTPDEKLRILKALVGKLLTLASSRALMEDCVEEQRAARQELREIRSEQHRREREEAALRVRLRKEERLREQEQRMKEREDKLKEQEMKSNRNESETPADPQGGTPLSQTLKAKVNQKEHQMTSDPKVTYLTTSLTAEELEHEQEKVRELQEQIQKAAACTSLLPLGRDRLYRRYWLLPSASALFVEDDGFGLTEDMLRPHPKPSQDTVTKTEGGETAKEEPAEGNVGSSPAPLHTCGAPVNRPNQWSFYSSMEEVDQLIEALNPRGHRESSLKEMLLQERERLQVLLQTCDISKYRHTDDPESSRSVPGCTATAETMMEVRLRDLLLDIEDRIHQGSLGTLKVMARQMWRSALEAGNYDLLSCSGREGAEGVEGAEPSCLRLRDRLQDMKFESTADNGGSGTPQVVSRAVRSLAQALAHIQQGIERRFLKPPLGDEDSKKDYKTKKNKKKDEDQTSDDGSDSGRVMKTVLERWRESLLSCSSLSQVFIHLSSLERSVMWSRSLLNARCRICRRKGDADNMLLCDACDRGHHTHCLRPRLKAVPEGDWFCPDCRPKQRSSRFPSRQRSTVEDEEEDSEDEAASEQQEEDSAEEESEEEEEESEEEDEEEEVFPSTKRSPAPALKGKGQQATAKNTTTTAAKNTSASKSSGKKATSLKANTAFSSKAPTRSGSRSSTRLSQEVQGPNAKPSVAQENRKRPAAEVLQTKAKKPVLPVLPATFSSTSTSRRSSGRNQGVHELSACEQLTVELVRHPDSWPFMKLVSRTQVPDYYDIIKKPMALSTIREKVNNCQYKTVGEFISDVELMFSNCLQYNPRQTSEAKAGQRLQQFFYSELSKLGMSQHSDTPPTKRSRH